MNRFKRAQDWAGDRNVRRANPLTAEFKHGVLRRRQQRREATLGWFVICLLGALLGLALKGCAVPSAGAHAVYTAQDAGDGMARTIEEGVPLEDGTLRVVTYDELVQYVYCLRYLNAALAYDLELADAPPDLAAYAPPGGWLAGVAPITSGGGE